MAGDLVAWGGDIVALAVGAPGANAWLNLLEDSGRITPDDRGLAQRPAAAELFATALDAAARTQQAERQRLLAAIVAAGLKDEGAVATPHRPCRCSGDVDMLLLLEQTAERLTDPHIRLLLLLEANQTEAIMGNVMVPDARLLQLWPEAGEVIVALRFVLEREGLIERMTSYDSGGLGDWAITDYGQRLLNHYRRLGGGL